MARLALVTDRKSGPVAMVDMPGALAVGDDVEVPDDLVLTEPGWTLFSFDLANAVANMIVPVICPIPSSNNGIPKNVFSICNLIKNNGTIGSSIANDPS